MVHSILKITLIPILRLFIKRITGKENIPPKEGFIIIANHESYMDPFLIFCVVIPIIDKKIHYLAKSEYTRTFGHLFEYLFYKKTVKTIIMYKNSSKKEIFNTALAFLKKGEVVGIFPKIPETKEIKTSFVRLALTSKVPILPIRLIGTRKIAPLGTRNLSFKKKLIKPHRAEIKILKPEHLTKYYYKKLNKLTIRKLTEKIYNQIEKEG